MQEYTLIAEAALTENQTLLKPAVIDTSGSVIKRISSSLPKKLSQKTVRLDNTILLPGFVNAHCHLELTKWGPLSHRDFYLWRNELLERKSEAKEEDYVFSVQAGLNRLMKSGVTTVFDHVSAHTPPRAYQNTPISVIGFGEVLGIHPETARHSYEGLKEIAPACPIPFYITPHAVHTVSQDVLRDVFKNEPQPFSIHLCESREEDDYFKSTGGSFRQFTRERYADTRHIREHKGHCAIHYLSQNNLNLNHSLIVHANYLRESDLEIIKNWRNCCVVHCPGSFEFFGHDTFLFEEMRKRKIPVALGTDSMASNRNLNFLNEIQLFLKNNPRIDLPALMPMITTNACRAIGLKNTGIISAGCMADMIGLKFKNSPDILDLLNQKKHADFLMAQGKLTGYF